LKKTSILQNKSKVAENKEIPEIIKEVEE